MKTSFAVIAASAVVLGGASAHAGSGVSVGVNLFQPAPVYYAPSYAPPVYYAPPQPVYYSPAPVYYGPHHYAPYTPAYRIHYWSGPQWRGDWLGRGRGGYRHGYVPRHR